MKSERIIEKKKEDEEEFKLKLIIKIGVKN